MSESIKNADILNELEPVVEKQLNRHLDQTRDWHPHEYVPWGEGRDFAMLGGEDWQLEQSRFNSEESKAVRAAFYVNLLTEDNLPSYHREITTVFGRDSAWGEWAHRWTAEEQRHSMAMWAYMMATRAIDPVELEVARMQQVQAGYDSGEKNPLEAISYVTMQELATRISHRNTGMEASRHGDQKAEKLLARIAMDENLHMLFYRNVGDAAFEIAPNDMMQAVTKEILGFQMPGSASIPEFWGKAADISNAGIYDLEIHANKILKPTLDHWNIWYRGDLTGPGAEARDKLGRYMLKLDQTVSNLEKSGGRD